MEARAPSVSIGLPVFNGENYLQLAIDSVLGQTLEDLELIICDNASTDSTEEICRAAAAADSRVRYSRNERNLGAAANYNLTLELARGRWFKWVAHDDVCRPRYLEVCVDVLRDEPDTVLAYPAALDIDADGEVIGPVDQRLGFDVDDPVERFRRVLTKVHGCTMFFGVTRTDILRLTGQHGNYPSADRVTLAELALWGRLREIDESLSLHREHPDRFLHTNQSVADKVAWFDPERAARLSAEMVWTRKRRGYLEAIARAPITRGQRRAAHRVVRRWTWENRERFLRDLGVITRIDAAGLRAAIRGAETV